MMAMGFLVSSNVHAQQPPHYSQYVFNNYLINPAVGGIGNYIDIKLGYRTQWLGFGAAPKTYLVSIHTPLKSNKREPRKFGDRNHHAIGGYATKDETGPINKVSGYFSYAYHMRLSYQLRAALGFFLGVKQYQLNTSTLWTATPDADLVPVNTITPDASVGGWLYTKKYFAGLSIHQLIPLALSPSSGTLKMHYFLTAGYKIPIKKFESTLIPSAHVKFGLLTPTQVDVTVKFDYKDMMWVGISYRKIDAVIGIIGFNLNNVVQVGYAFDFTTSKLRKYSSNTHEIIIGLRYKPRKKIRDPRCPTWG